MPHRRPRLLALDMDGTLLRADGVLDPRDRAAIVDAVARGVTVTLATGRVASGALPAARELGLAAPLICADGAQLVCARTGARLEHRPLELRLAASTMRAMDTHALAPFVLTHDAVHADERGRAHADYVGVWTRNVTVHPARLAEAAGAWGREGEVTLAIGIGPEPGVLAARAALEAAHAAELEVLSFRVNRAPGDRWALLARPRGIHKGEALARLAARLGVAREDTAAVGDWYNDVSMLAWAGRSFAMGQAPPDVRATATDALEATSSTGGGVAEALARWLA